MSNDRFEKWWLEAGQHGRAGGGEYEKTFAFNAWNAALSAQSPAPRAEAAEPVAWLFECRKPGQSIKYASIEDRGTEHWPVDQWTSVVKTPLVPLPSQRQCPGADPLCPCQDGDTCHYEGENPFPLPPQRQEASCAAPDGIKQKEGL